MKNENSVSFATVHTHTHTGNPIKTRNFVFDLLYVLAIIMVVDDHTNIQVGILSKLFPYDSFFMPMFVFISGYFYKKQNIFENVKHKAKKMLIPAVIWNITMLIIALFIDKIIGTHWFYMPTVKSFIISLFDGTMTSLNGPAWFVVMLLWVSITYNILRNIIKPNNKVTDIIVTIALTLLGFTSVYLCAKGWCNRGVKYVFLLKLSFYIQFFNLGYIFKEYFEEKIKRIKRWKIYITCITVNCILILIFGEKVNFFGTSEMNGFSYWFLPFITSCTGILFWYTVMSFLAQKIEKNEKITFVAKNTFTIMESHLMFANIINILFYILYKKNILENFNCDVFRYTAWNGAAWASKPFSGMLGFLLGITLSIVLAIILDNGKKKIRKIIGTSYE